MLGTRVGATLGILAASLVAAFPGGSAVAQDGGLFKPATSTERDVARDALSPWAPKFPAREELKTLRETISGIDQVNLHARVIPRDFLTLDARSRTIRANRLEPWLRLNLFPDAVLEFRRQRVKVYPDDRLRWTGISVGSRPRCWATLQARAGIVETGVVRCANPGATYFIDRLATDTLLYRVQQMDDSEMPAAEPENLFGDYPDPDQPPPPPAINRSNVDVFVVRVAAHDECPSFQSARAPEVLE